MKKLLEQTKLNILQLAFHIATTKNGNPTAGDVLSAAKELETFFGDSKETKPTLLTEKED